MDRWTDCGFRVLQGRAGERKGGRAGERRKELNGDGWAAEGMRSVRQIEHRPRWIDLDRSGMDSSVGWDAVGEYSGRSDVPVGRRRV